MMRRFCCDRIAPVAIRGERAPKLSGCTPPWSTPPQRDVIETPLESVWDVNGWDLRKALRLLRKSNPPLFEWLQSPIVYRERGSAAREIRALLAEFFRADAAAHHYLHMAQGNYREFLRRERVWRKKYFYVLRPLLACRWIESERGPVPMEFERLVDATVRDPALRGAIDALLAEKRAGDELGEGPRIEPISAFIESELARHEHDRPAHARRLADAAPLNALLARALDEVWSP
jgi:predicted nucleotidyltransferase